MAVSRNQDEISAKPKEILTLGSFAFDPARRELLDAEGRPVELRRQSADVLAELAREPGRMVAKRDLIDSIWRDTAVTDDSLVQCIADIRRKLGPGARDCVQTVPRRGYRLVPSGPAAPGPSSFVRGLTALFIAFPLALALAAVLTFRESTDAPTVPEEPPTLAILPFVNLSGDPEQRYFSDGLTEDLTTDLSRTSALRAISSASSFSYRDSDLPPADVANELGASHYVTGSVRRDGRRLRINATLSDASSGAIIWAHRYDRDLGGIFDLQDDVTAAITAALAVELTSSEEERFARQQQIDPDAYDLLLRGLEPLRRFTPEGIDEARGYFRRAIEIEPDYARAHANLALSYGQALVFRYGEDDSMVPEALRMAERAAELDPDLPQAQFALAVLHLSARNHDAAIAAARRAVELDPSYADGFAVLAQTLAYGGDLDEALAAIRKAKLLSPRHTFAYLWVEAHILFQMRRYAEAREILKEVVARNPALLVGYLTLAATYGHLDMTEEADWLLTEILAISPAVSATAEGDAAPYRDAADRRHYVDGLLLAGIPP